MKEATGELNMTAVTLIAIAAVGALFYFAIWPIVQLGLASRACAAAYGKDYRAVTTGETENTGGQVSTSSYKCCLNGEDGENCFAYNENE